MRGSLKGVAHRERRFFTIFNVFFDGSVYILRAGALCAFLADLPRFVMQQCHSEKRPAARILLF